MNKKHKYLLIDCETTGTLKKPIVYDIGGAIIDRQGNVYSTFSFVIKEIWNNISLLQSAYYKDKLPRYMYDLLNGTRELASFKEIMKYINKLCKNYEIKAIIAHNMYFDNLAINYTIDYFNDNTIDNFMEKYPLWDTLKMSKSVITTKKSYIDYCNKYGFMTNHKKPQPRATAEILYRYISNNVDFIESHTSLEDVLIEKEIFTYCIKQKKKMNRVYK